MKKTLKFTWQQELPVPNDMGGWRLYSSLVPEGTDKVLIADIPFVAEQTDYFTEQEFEVSQSGNLYFFVTAYDTSGNESGLSAPVFEVFDITPPAIPISFTVTVIG
jgi:hypothetical protein